MSRRQGIFAGSYLQRDLPIFTIWVIGALLCLLAGTGLWWLLGEMKAQSWRDAGKALMVRLNLTHEFVHFWAKERAKDTGFIG